MSGGDPARLGFRRHLLGDTWPVPHGWGLSVGLQDKPGFGRVTFLRFQPKPREGHRGHSFVSAGRAWGFPIGAWAPSRAPATLHGSRSLPTLPRPPGTETRGPRWLEHPRPGCLGAWRESASCSDGGRLCPDVSLSPSWNVTRLPERAAVPAGVGPALWSHLPRVSCPQMAGWRGVRARGHGTDRREPPNPK